MFEFAAVSPTSRIPKQGALGFAARAFSYSVGVRSFGFGILRALRNLDDARDLSLLGIYNASMKALSFGLQAHSPLL